MDTAKFIEQIIHESFSFIKGRVALYALMEAIGVEKDDEVIIPAFTCIAVPNAIIYHGAKPVYVDICEDSYNMDPVHIEKSISKKTKIIIAQHTYGIPADMDSINNIAKKNKIWVIEDACHSLGSKYKGKEIGTFGDAAFYSSQWSKPITTGLGGWALINNPQLKPKMNEIYLRFTHPTFLENIKLLIQYLLYSILYRPYLFWYLQNTYRMLSELGITIGSLNKAEQAFKMPEGYEKKLTRWQKKIIIRKLSRIDDVILHRRKIVNIYEECLPKLHLKNVSLDKLYEPVYLRYPLVVKDKKKVLSEAKRKRVEIGDWFVSPIHPNLDGWEKAFYLRGTCPVSEYMFDHVINLPTHCGIDKDGAYEILKFLEEVE